MKIISIIVRLLKIEDGDSCNLENIQKGRLALK